MRPFFLALLTTAAVGLPAVAQDDPAATSDAEMRRGQTAFAAGDYATATAAFERALELDPANATALNDLAWLLVTAEDPEFLDAQRALELATAAVAHQPNSDAFLDTLATARHALGQALPAARLELRALRLNTAQPFYAEQLEAFARDALDPPNPEAHSLIGCAALARGQHQRALNAFDRARDLDAEDDPELTGRIAAGRGEALAALERWEEAVVALERARALEGRALSDALAGLHARGLQRLGRTDEAAETFEEALRERPGAGELWVQAARVWREAQRPDACAQLAERAMDALRAHPPLWPGKERARLWTVAARAWEDRLRENPDGDPEARKGALLAWVRSAAARAEDRTADARALEHAWAVDAELAGLDPSEVRRRLAAEYLGVADAPGFRRVDGAWLPNAGGRRVAIADVNLDGKPDVLCGRVLWINALPEPFRAQRLPIEGRGGVFADMDRDGDLDLYALGGGARGDRLLRNDLEGGVATFVDVTGELTDDFPSEGAAWGDLNGDGYPDLWVANYERNGEPLGRATPDRLYLSDGAGGFTDASARLSGTPLACGRGVSMADVDQDGDLDVFVSNYRLNPDHLWINQDGALTESAATLGVQGQPVRGAYGHTIGAAWGDLDLDGDLDLVAANLAHPRFIDFSDQTMIYLQGPDGRFLDARARVGVEFEETHSDPTLFDADNDGDLDLYLTSVYETRPSYLWRNDVAPVGTLSFTDVTWASSTRVFNGWGAAAADLDLDGDLDLVVAGQGGIHVFENTTGGASVRVRLVGVTSDTWGAGATAVLSAPDGSAWTRQVTLGHGTTSQSEPILHFGVEGHPGPYQLDVRWPSGQRQRVALTPGLHQVREPN